ncbi:thiamine pyrophosphate-binding protein [Glutamicibacter halophytocola]|uniref:Thiamine pyrophosphate-binding protein n=1 Tax=Glutamicibacter halophytocola TaxID=1933880 RepID=A0ABX5YBJ6_9MICC|nr:MULTISPECIES: thiamine pyrophosphate-binding protein [Glutamicibacter]MBF6673562.1 thiamine pyrophosphate-binding protein [Glutamicibacter sp. FBE19]QDY67072.1 thiamine pyrophosphate-binding protein [Glutamicibacter halophytocola]
MSSVSAAIAHALKPVAPQIFGLMGNGNAHFLDAAIRAGFDYTAVRHESAAVSAADAYFRISNQLAIATTTYGAGYTNAVTALAEAAAARTPLLFVTGDAPSTGLRGWDVDQGAIDAGVRAPRYVVDRHTPGSTALQAAAHALREQAPVVLAIPYDLAAAECAGEELPDVASLACLPPTPRLEPAALAQIATKLNASKRTHILYGRGAIDAAEQVKELAQKLDATTSGTLLARDLLDYEFDLGITGGFSTEANTGIIARADTVLVLGASLNQFTTRFGELINESATLIQIDLGPAATNARVDCFATADAQSAALDLLGAVEAAESSWCSGLDLHDVRSRPAGDEKAEDGLLDPRRVASELEKILPANRVLVQDGGHFIGWGPMYWSTTGARSLACVGTAYQSIGLGIASMVGAGAAAEGRTVVLAAGDGGFLMGLADLESIIRTIDSGVIVIYNDSAYGAEVHQYGSIGLHEDPMLIPTVDFAGIARSMGATGVRVEELADLAGLRQWVADGARGVCLVDARISARIRAPYMEEVLAANKKAAAALALQSD